MLYLIGGVPRSGKSIIRRKLLNEHKIPGITLDMIIDMLHIAMPELDINTAVDRKVLYVRLWPFVEALIETRLKTKSDFVIEGEYFTPEKVARFIGHKNIKICFMLYPEISIEDKMEQIKRFKEQKEWYGNLSDEKLRPFVQTFHERSHLFKGQCEVHKIPFFDTSYNFEKVIDEAVRFLVNK